MNDKHSLFPVGPFTEDIPEHELAGLVARHAITYEIGPHQSARPDGLVRRGWVVDLYGHRSRADEKLPGEEARHHVHDVLHAIARALVPDDRRGELSVALEPFTGAVRIDPRHDFAEEIRLRIDIELDPSGRMSMLGDADTAWRDEIVERLEALGVHPH